MKIIKRDGTIADYNPEKIKIAISKANLEVDEEERASEEEIEKIIKYIEKLKKARADAAVVDKYKKSLKEQHKDYNDSDEVFCANYM